MVNHGSSSNADVLWKKRWMGRAGLVVAVVAILAGTWINRDSLEVMTLLFKNLINYIIYIDSFTMGALHGMHHDLHNADLLTPLLCPVLITGGQAQGVSGLCLFFTG
jgi:hypothetical protein